MTTTRFSATVAIVGVVLLAAPGCVRRTIEITSEPSGALVILNDREVGRTPVDVEFTYYGDYDVRLSLEGYEPLVTKGVARAPLWDNVPLDLGAEMLPTNLESRIAWHYELAPENGLGLMDRARSAQQELGSLESK